MVKFKKLWLFEHGRVPEVFKFYLIIQRICTATGIILSL